MVKSEREALRDGRDSSYYVWFGDGSTNKKTGSSSGSGRGEDAKFFLLGGMRMEKIRNEYTRGTTQV